MMDLVIPELTLEPVVRPKTTKRWFKELNLSLNQCGKFGLSCANEGLGECQTHTRNICTSKNYKKVVKWVRSVINPA
jgi:hypothetical protein